MVNIFFIDLRTKMAKIKTERFIKSHNNIIKINTPNVSLSKSIEDLNRSRLSFKRNTKTLVGKIKSFIPFTENFIIRLECARNIKNIHSTLRIIKNDHKRKIKAIFLCFSEKQTKISSRNYSSDDDIVYRSKNHKSPISQPVRPPIPYVINDAIYEEPVYRPNPSKIVKARL